MPWNFWPPAHTPADAVNEGKMGFDSVQLKLFSTDPGSCLLCLCVLLQEMYSATKPWQAPAAPDERAEGSTGTSSPRDPSSMVQRLLPAGPGGVVSE